jgi:hypothetical protein
VAPAALADEPARRALPWPLHPRAGFWNNARL